LERAKKLADLLSRVAHPFRRLAEQRNVAVTEDQVIRAIIQRIEVEGEEQWGEEEGVSEETFRRLVARLKWQVRQCGLTPDGLIRGHLGEVRAILLMKSYEKLGSKESSFLRESFISLGMKNVQPGVWVLPPVRTPADLSTQDDVKAWLRQKVVKPVRKKVDYVFPFVALVDLKRVAADRRGIRKMPTARTIYSVLEPEDVVAASEVYSAMRQRGFSAMDVVLSGNLVLLASAFATEEEVQSIAENNEEIMTRLRRSTGSASVTLEDLANIGPEIVAASLEGFVQHPDDTAKRLLVEVQFWMRFLSGSA
jgi:hypothetical protein